MKEYNYNGIRYKRDNNGQWQYFDPTYNKWVYTYYNAPSINGTAVYDSDYLEKAFKAKDPWLKETTTQKVEQDAVNAKKAQDRSSMLNNPLIPTDAKIKQISNNAPTVENANTLKQLQVQKQKEDEKAAKQRQLDQQEEARIQALRTSGSDNTRVNNISIPEFEIKNPIEEWETITKAQKREASRIVNTGDFAKHFPELRDYYLSKENSHRPGGPLTMEEIVLEKIRTDPNFFQTLDNRKFEDFKRREQAAYDDMNFFEKGANMITAFAADPLMTANNVFLRWERPLAYQASMSNEPEALGDDYRYFDKMTGQSESTLNNMLNYINPFRAATHLGQDLAQGDYSGAALNAASIIPMVKGAKAGWKGVTSLMKASPTTLANYTKSNLIKNASPLMQNISNKATVGNLLTGYGGYEAATHYFPEAYDAYAEGDWKKGNENLFMGAAMATPIAMELRANNAIPKTIQGAKGLYNDVATGNSFIPKAWKNPAAGLDGGISETMFNKILQSDDFTSAEKAMLKEYQYGNHPFIKPGPKQDAFNELIGKANLKFPEDAVVTRAFSNPERDFQAFTGAPDDIKTISIQDRPSAFSAGVSNKDKYFYGKTDRIVISGKNLKKLEGNFAKQRYEPLEEGYYTNMPDEELTVIDNSKNQGDSIGDNYYGTQRLTPDELRAQAEAKYLKDSELYTNPENSWLKPSQDPNKLTGQPKSGNPEDGVFTAEESAQIIKEQNERYAEKMRLFSDPANKEEAIQKLISEANEGFANKSGPIDELELFGSGFDMKVVGKFPNKHGGFDYVVQPKNIRKLKKSNIESESIPSPSKISDKPVAYGESSDLTIGPDKMPGMNYTRIANESEKQQLLNEFPEKITTVYREQWPSKGYKLEDDFPMSRAGQQQALEESTDFALKWAFKDSDTFKETDKILGPSVKRLNEIKGKGDYSSDGLYRKTVDSLNRQLRSVNAQDEDEAIKEFLRLNPDKTIADIGDHTTELVEILGKQNPNNGIIQRLVKTSRTVSDLEDEVMQINRTIEEQMKIVESNIDPTFKEKILKIYEDTMYDDPSAFDDVKNAFNEPYASGVSENFTGIDKKIKIVHPAKHEPSFQSLSPFEKMYIANNYDNIGGVALENSTISLGSKPNELSNQFMGVAVPKVETLETASDPKVIHFIDQYMTAPDRIAEVTAHEIGHDFQKLFGRWISRLQQNDPAYGYYVTRQDPKSQLLTMMKEVMVEPTLPTADSKMVTSMTEETWLAAPNELHSDLMIARYKLAKELMKTYKISMDEAIANIKAPENQDYYAEWLMKDPEVAPHFKTDAPDELKAGIIKFLPMLIPAVGYGVMQGINSETPQNRYGGNIKKLSKFIRK